MRTSISTFGVLSYVLSLAMLAMAACGEPKPATPPITGEIAEPDPPRNKRADTPGATVQPDPRADPVTAETPDPDADLEATNLVDEFLRLNQLQSRGTHNSYHLHPLDNSYPGWQYDMPLLGEQMTSHGIRALELDVHAVNGGFAVYHIDGDARSTCPMLAACVTEIAAWSAAHPAHVPITVFLELKGAWTADQVNAMEQVIALQVSRDQIFTPDDLTAGRYATVVEAMQNEGWPTLGKLRGKLLFSLMAYQPLPFYFTGEGRTLQGRLLFITDTLINSPHAVILSYDYSVEQEAAIRDAVGRGFLVRTRTDDYPGRIGDPGATLRAALRSGAHFVLTDYPTGSPYFPGYDSTLSGGTPVRCNPVSAGADCNPEAFE